MLNLIVVVVTVVWAASFVSGILVRSYSPPAAINLALMTILGGVFGFRLVRGSDHA